MVQKADHLFNQIKQIKLTRLIIECVFSVPISHLLPTLNAVLVVPIVQLVLQFIADFL